MLTDFLLFNAVIMDGFVETPAAASHSRLRSGEGHGLWQSRWTHITRPGAIVPIPLVEKRCQA